MGNAVCFLYRSSMRKSITLKTASSVDLKPRGRYAPRLELVESTINYWFGGM